MGFITETSFEDYLLDFCSMGVPIRIISVAQIKDVVARRLRAAAMEGERAGWRIPSHPTGSSSREITSRSRVRHFHTRIISGIVGQINTSGKSCTTLGYFICSKCRSDINRLEVFTILKRTKHGSHIGRCKRREIKRLKLRT